MKTIEITVSPEGDTRVQTRGYSGSECREASRFIESALGCRGREKLTAEYYQTADGIQTHNTTENGNGGNS